MIRTRTSY